MPNEVFLDTACAIALSSPADRFHARAKALAKQIEASSTVLTRQTVTGWIESVDRFANALIHLIPEQLATRFFARL
jgi:predicted nucleic acid-binding protein